MDGAPDSSSRPPGDEFLRVTSDTPNSPLNANQFFASARGQRLLKAVSDKTGIAQPDLKSQLLAGTSLQDILESKQLTFADIQQTLHGMTGRSGPPVSPGGGSPALDSSILSSLASTLRLDHGDLAQRLKGGAGLDQIAAEQAVQPDVLNTALRKAVEAVTAYGADGTRGGVAASAGSVQIDASA